MKHLLSDASAPGTWVRFTSARRAGAHLQLGFALGRGKQGRASANYRVTCSGVREWHITQLDGGGLRLYSPIHPAARQHTAPKRTLIVRPGVATVTMLGVLVQAHAHAVMDWIPFDRYVGDPEVIGKQLSAGKRVALRGPDFLMKAYAAALARAGVSARLGAGRSRATATRRLRVLHFGESYVVAHRFRAQTSETTG